MAQMISRKYILLLTLMAIPLLAGSQCAFFFSSGGGSSDSGEEENRGLVAVVSTGTFVDAPVDGLNYESGSVSGITGSDGQFEYEVGNTIRFFIGDVDLGEAVKGKSLITPLDLVNNGEIDTPAVINIARLLQSLDSNPDDEIITIPDEVRAAAVRSNEGLSSAIEFLDYSDDPAFINAASHLVAVLTRDYPFTATLVGSSEAREHMIRSIRKQAKQ